MYPRVYASQMSMEPVLCGLIEGVVETGPVGVGKANNRPEVRTTRIASVIAINLPIFPRLKMRRVAGQLKACAGPPVFPPLVSDNEAWRDGPATFYWTRELDAPCLSTRRSV